MRWTGFAAALACAVLCCGGALAQSAPDPSPQSEETDLYMQAMQAIAAGKNEEASNTLARMVANGPRHAGEWLDLALINCALGRADDAEQLFRSIEQRFEPPQGIRDIITQQRVLGCSRWKPLSLLSFSAGRGYDHNVNQGARNPEYTLGGPDGETVILLPEYLPKRDHYTVLSGDYMRELNQRGTLGFVQVGMRRNDRLDDYNTASLFGGLEQPWQLGRWRMRASAFTGMLRLGGRLYQQHAQVQLRATPPIDLPGPLELYGVAALSYVNYKTLTNFDSNTSELRAVLAHRAGPGLVQASVGFLNDHAVGTRPGGDRDGWYLGLSGRRRLNQALQVELDLARQSWNGELAYSPPVIPDVRAQRTMTARATMVYALSQNHSLRLEARHVRNKENISIFEYHNTVLQLSWQWSGN